MHLPGGSTWNTFNATCDRPVSPHRHHHKNHVPNHCVCLFTKYGYSALQHIAWRQVKSMFGKCLSARATCTMRPEKCQNMHPPRGSMHIESWTRIARTVFSLDARNLNSQPGRTSRGHDTNCQLILPVNFLEYWVNSIAEAYAFFPLYSYDHRHSYRKCRDL